MENIYIEGNGTLPTVELKVDGTIKFSGRALPENPIQFFQPLIEWDKMLNTKDVHIEINMDYFNTSVSKQLYDFFKSIENNSNVENIYVKWLYEEGDDETLEAGRVYQEILPRFRFSFHQYSDVT